MRTYQNFIGGEWVAAKSGQTFQNQNPADTREAVAIYPLSGSQAPGGMDEYRGVRLAIDMVNASGGVLGHRIDLRTVDTPDADAAPAASHGWDDNG